MRIVILLILFVQSMECHALNNTDSIYGGSYNYIEFAISKPHQYPIVFAVVTTNDTIKIDTSNIESFFASISIKCESCAISDNAYHIGFELVYGKSEQIYNCCSLFISDFNDNFNQLNQTKTINLKTGEKIIIRYFNIIGVFLKLGEKFYAETSSSIGPSTIVFGKKSIVPICIA